MNGLIVARPERFELPTPRSVVWCSVQLSYGRTRDGATLVTDLAADDKLAQLAASAVSIASAISSGAALCAKWRTYLPSGPIR